MRKTLALALVLMLIPAAVFALPVGATGEDGSWDSPYVFSSNATGGAVGFFYDRGDGEPDGITTRALLCPVRNKDESLGIAFVPVVDWEALSQTLVDDDAWMDARGTVVYCDGANYVLSGHRPAEGVHPGDIHNDGSFYFFNAYSPYFVPWEHPVGSYLNPLICTDVADALDAGPGTYFVLLRDNDERDMGKVPYVVLNPTYDSAVSQEVYPWPFFYFLFLANIPEDAIYADDDKYSLVYHSGGLFIASGLNPKGARPGHEETPTAFYSFDPMNPHLEPWAPLGTFFHPYSAEEADAYREEHGTYPLLFYGAIPREDVAWDVPEILSAAINPLQRVMFITPTADDVAHVPVFDATHVLKNISASNVTVDWTDYEGVIIRDNYTPTNQLYALSYNHYFADGDGQDSNVVPLVRSTYTVDDRLFIMSGKEAYATEDGKRYIPFPTNYEDTDAYYPFLPLSPQFSPWMHPLGSFENPLTYAQVTEAKDNGNPPTLGTFILMIAVNGRQYDVPFVIAGKATSANQVIPWKTLQHHVLLNKEYAELQGEVIYYDGALYILSGEDPGMALPSREMITSAFIPYSAK